MEASRPSAATAPVGQAIAGHESASVGTPVIEMFPTIVKALPQPPTPVGKTSPFDPALEDTATDKARGTVIGRANAKNLDDVLEVQIIEDNTPSTPYDDSGTINLGIEAERSVASRVRGRGSRSAKTSRSSNKPPLPVWAWGAIAAGLVVVVIIIAVLASSGDTPQQPKQQAPPQQAPSPQRRPSTA